METANLERRRASMPSCNRIVTREEYDALMFELAQKAIPELTASTSDIDMKLKKLEFNLMILVGLVLIVFMLCRPS
jgi:hypothetical protein